MHMGQQLTPEAITDFAILAIEAAANPGSWHSLCDRIADEIGAKAFFVIAYDLQERSMPQVFSSSAFRCSAGRAIVQAEREGDGDEDLPIYRALECQSPGLVISEHDLADGRKRGAGIGNHWRDRMLGVTGGRDRSVMKLNDVGPFLDCVAVHDAVSHESSLPMAPFAPVLHPLLSRTLETTRIVTGLVESHERLMSLFDRLDFGAAFCTADGRVITANRAFRTILTGGGGLREAARGLEADGRSGTDSLHGLIAAAARPMTLPERLTLALPRRYGRLPLVLFAAPARERDLGPANAVLLLAIDPEDKARLNANGLAALGVLTEAELEVCSLLVQGFETVAIAEQRDTRPDTTRDQIKAAAAKLSCRSRLDILRLAMATATPVRG